MSITIPTCALTTALPLLVLACASNESVQLDPADALAQAPASAGKSDGSDAVVVAQGDRIYILGAPAGELRSSLLAGGNPVQLAGDLQIVSRGPVACAELTSGSVCTFLISNPESGFVVWDLIGDEALQAESGYDFWFGGDANPEAKAIFEALRPTTTNVSTSGDLVSISTPSWECDFAPAGQSTCGFFATPCAVPEQSFCRIVHK